MGKKRRLNSAKTKFAAKRSAHPRAKLLAQQAAVETETIEEVLPEVVEVVTETAPKTTTAKKTTTTKKKATVPKKRSTKKTITEASA